MPTHDAIVIGAGQAGPGVARHLATQGQRVALIEEDKVGGTCLNVGCRPTKALRASARVAHLARRSSSYGIGTGDVTVDLAAAMARKDEMIGRWRGGYEQMLKSTDNLELVEGHGAFVGTHDGVHEVAVGSRVLSSRHVILDVGTRPRVPDIEGLADTPYLTNASILELDAVPERLVVLGGSYIGLEFAQMFARFGSRVVVLEHGPRIAAREDEDISAALTGILRAEGIEVVTDADVTAARGSAGALEVVCADGSSVQGTHLLVAVGRVPNTDRLGLESIGLRPNGRGILETDGVYRTAVPGVVALGDINGRGAFTHTAYADYEIYVDHLEGGSRSADDRIPTYAMFTDPPLGRVGMSEGEARKSGRKVLRATYAMKDLTKAVLDGETEGLIKILVDAETDRLLGAACLGLFGDEIVQVISALMHADAPCRVLARMLPVHPTVAEFFPTILGRLEPL